MNVVLENKKNNFFRNHSTLIVLGSIGILVVVIAIATGSLIITKKHTLQLQSMRAAQERDRIMAKYQDDLLDRSEYEISHGLDPFSFSTPQDVLVSKTVANESGGGGGAAVTTFTKKGMAVVTVRQYTSAQGLAADTKDKGDLVNRPYQVGGVPAELYKNAQGDQNIIVPSKLVWIAVPAQQGGAAVIGGAQTVTEIIQSIKFLSDQSET